MMWLVKYLIKSGLLDPMQEPSNRLLPYEMKQLSLKVSGRAIAKKV